MSSALLQNACAASQHTSRSSLARDELRSADKYLNLDLLLTAVTLPLNAALINQSSADTHLSPDLGPAQSAGLERGGAREGERRTQSGGYSRACRARRNLYAACQYEILMMAGGWA